MTAAAPSLLFVVTEDWYFASHRLGLAIGARAAGFRVSVATRFSKHAADFAAHGLECIPLDISRGLTQPGVDLAAFTALYRLYRDLQPDLVHHVALKPILIGTLAARAARLPKVVNAFTGLGHIFTASERRTRLVRRLAIPILKHAVAGENIFSILQNGDDMRTLASLRIIELTRSALIPGSGVDLRQFRPAPSSTGIPIVLMAARMTRNKGIHEFAEAAWQLRQQRQVRFVLVGPLDTGNPSVVDPKQIEQWQQTGIEYWGWCRDMPRIYSQADIVCLPTHGGEGVPKVLLEAGACQRPVIATDVGGCRDLITNGIHGLLIPPRNAVALAQAIALLLDNKALGARLARSLRDRVVADYDQAGVVRTTLAWYQHILNTA